MTSAVIDVAGLQQLVSTLIDRGYRVVGPTLSDNAIVLGELTSADDLPQGWGVDVGPGHYRLRRRDDDALFGHSAGPQSWKQFLHPPRQKLWSSDGQEPEQTPRYAFLGVRACDLAAIAMLNGVLGKGAHPVQGSWDGSGASSWWPSTAPNPAGCASARPWAPVPRRAPGTTWRSPSASTRRPPLRGRRRQRGRRRGAGRGAAPGGQQAEIDRPKRVAEAAHHMGRQMPSGDLRELLIESRESPHWEEVASRCLTCGNCTMVCPTCFCTSTEDVTDLTGQHAERWLNWASCFEFDFSFVHRAASDNRGRRGTGSG